ncbi:hypothetical protein [Streptomyces tauricus]|uniref:hypothetical protein n=1 Tax=Streptomyces tauricus TaxID=68274 RepID=UPI00341D0E02
MSAIDCPVNPLGHDWNNGLACRYCPATRTPGEAIVSGLASRRGGTEEAARALLASVREEVLAEAGAAHSGSGQARGRIHAMFPILDSPAEAEQRETDLDQRLDEHRAEVLAEADLLPKADVVAWLTKKAREETPVELLASKAARGAIRPDNLRMLPPRFFEADRTYTRGRFTFHCLAIGTSPINGEVWALGLSSRDGAIEDGNVVARDATDWEHGGWTDITDTTTGDNA